MSNTSSMVLGFLKLTSQLSCTVFPISLLFPLYQGNTLALPNNITSLVDFLTTCKSLWRLCGFAGMSDSKNPKLYHHTWRLLIGDIPISFCCQSDSANLGLEWIWSILAINLFKDISNKFKQLSAKLNHSHGKSGFQIAGRHLLNIWSAISISHNQF